MFQCGFKILNRRRTGDDGAVRTDDNGFGPSVADEGLEFIVGQFGICLVDGVGPQQAVGSVRQTLLFLLSQNVFAIFYDNAVSYAPLVYLTAL